MPMNQRIDQRGLSILTAEALKLSNKLKPSKQEERRYTAVLAGISAIKAGATLDEIQLQDLNSTEVESGLPVTRITGKRLDAEKRAKGTFFQSLVRGNCGEAKIPGGYEFRCIEKRTNEAEGSVLSQIGTYTGLGNYVPTDMFATVKEALAEIDVLFKDDGPCTVIHSTNSNPLRIPVYDDTSEYTAQIAEGVSDGSVALLQNPASVTLVNYSFRTPVHPFSMEVFQDAGESYDAAQLFEKFSAKRLARAIGKTLLTGNGSGTITGLLTALEAFGANAIVAQGSSSNTGLSGQTAVNSIGSQDLGNLVFSINDEYRSSKSCGFLMNTTTLAFLSTLVTKQGLPLVNFRDGIPTILGFPVYACPSMPAIGSSAISAVFGDLSYWHTRLTVDAFSRIRVIKEAPGLAENGLVGMQMLMRAGGAYAYTGPGVNSPINYLIQHS